MVWDEQRHPDASSLVMVVARALENLCRDAIADRGQALLALAGGRTPLPVYAQLAQTSIDWGNVTIVPTDERCVPHDHPACNLRELRSAFTEAAGLATFVSLTADDGEPPSSLALARTHLAQLKQPFDAVVLGMGLDAHTASLFPHAEGLASALDPHTDVDAVHIDPRPLPVEAPYSRITLTAARLLRARNVHLLIIGESKYAALKQARMSHDPLQHPIAALLQAPALVTIHWSP